MNKKFMALFFLSSLAFAYAAGENPSITPKLPAMKDSCYQVSSVEELYGFAAAMNGSDGFEKDSINECMELHADIVINKNVLDDTLGLAGDTSSYYLWTPIKRLNWGTIKGNGHTISGLVAIQPTKHDHWGFVGYADRSITISKLHIRDAFIRDFGSSGHGCGGFVGTAYGTLIATESSFSGVVNSSQPTGGFVGDGSAKISNSAVFGNISGSDAGGFVGNVKSSAEITRSYNEALIYSANAGGFVGNVSNPGKRAIISESYNVGKIKTTSWDKAAGGFVGSLFMGEVVLYNVYNAGDILEAEKSGALVGQNLLNSPGTVKVANSFNIGKKVDCETKLSNYQALVGGTIGSSGAVENSFFLTDTMCNEFCHGTSISEKEFEDGTLLKMLQPYRDTLYYFTTNALPVDGSVWSQEIGKDKYPVLKNASLDAVVKKRIPSMLQISVSGQTVEFSGARIGSSFAVFDISGKVLKQGSVSSVTHSVEIPNAGLYIVRVGTQSQVVKIHK